MFFDFEVQPVTLVVQRGDNLNFFWSPGPAVVCEIAFERRVAGVETPAGFQTVRAAGNKNNRPESCAPDPASLSVPDDFPAVLRLEQSECKAGQHPFHHLQQLRVHLFKSPLADQAFKAVMLLDDSSINCATFSFNRIIGFSFKKGSTQESACFLFIRFCGSGKNADRRKNDGGHQHDDDHLAGRHALAA